MAYKDKDKQREANRERQRRYKAKQKALPKGVTSQGVTDKVLPESWEEFSKTHVVATLVDVPEKPKPVSDAEFTRLMVQANPKTKLRVSKPGDADYDGICTPEWIAERKAE